MGRSNNPNIAEHGKAHRLKKGQSGNPSGRPKSKMLSDAYRSKLEESVPNDPEGRTWAELIAEAQVRDAVRGNVQAAREIADRTEGRVPTQLKTPSAVLHWTILIGQCSTASNLLLSASGLLYRYRDCCIRTQILLLSAQRCWRGEPILEY